MLPIRLRTVEGIAVSRGGRPTGGGVLVIPPLQRRTLFAGRTLFAAFFAAATSSAAATPAPTPTTAALALLVIAGAPRRSVSRLATLPWGGFVDGATVAKREIVLFAFTAAGWRFDRFPSGLRRRRLRSGGLRGRLRTAGRGGGSTLRGRGQAERRFEATPIGAGGRGGLVGSQFLRRPCGRRRRCRCGGRGLGRLADGLGAERVGEIGPGIVLVFVFRHRWVPV